MQVSLEAAEGLERRLSIEIPGEEIDGEINNRLKKLAQQAKVSGFRPGRVPLSVVKQRYGKQVRAEVLEAAVQKNFSKAIQQENLTPVSMPEITPISDVNAKSDFRFMATFEVYPDVVIRNVENMVINKPVVEITESDVNNEIDKLRKQNAEWVSAEGNAQNEDKLTVDFVGTINGEKFEGGEAKQVALVLGLKQMVAGFDENLVNSSEGETVEFDVSFPDDYHSKDVAGKEAHFSVIVTKIERAILPELTDEFVASLGIVAENGQVNIYDEVRRSMSRELDQAIKNEIRSSVFDALIAENPIEIPKVLIALEGQQMADQMNERLKMVSNASIKRFTAADFEQQSRRRVALSILLSEIVNKNNLKASPEETRKAIEDIAAGYDEPDKIVDWYYTDKDKLKSVESAVVENEVIDWVLAHAQVGKKETSFETLVRV